MQPCQYSLMRRDVCPPWSTGLDLRGWGWARRLAEGWGPRLARQWLQRMSSVYREMRRGRGGDAETAAFTLYCKLHTHAHTLTQALTQKAVATLETPQALQCVCVCLCYSWPAGTSGSEWHISPRLQLNMVQAGWGRARRCWLTIVCFFVSLLQSTDTFYTPLILLRKQLSQNGFMSKFPLTLVHLDFFVCWPLVLILFWFLSNYWNYVSGTHFLIKSDLLDYFMQMTCCWCLNISVFKRL